MIDLTSRSVTTIAGDGKSETRDGTGLKCSISNPRYLVFDRSPNAKPNLVLLITSERAIRRFDTETGAVTTLKTSMSLDPVGIVETPSGHLIVTCYLAHAVYSIDPVTAGVTGLVGTGTGNGTATQIVKLHYPSGLAVVKHEQCVYVTDSNQHQIRRITLPPHMFIPKRRIEADLKSVWTEITRISHLQRELTVHIDATGQNVTTIESKEIKSIRQEITHRPVK